MSGPKKAYLLVHSTKAASHEQMKAYLNAMRTIETWRSDIANCFVVISSFTAKELAKSIRALTTEGRFIISEISADSSGWLSPETWTLIRDKKTTPPA